MDDENSKLAHITVLRDNIEFLKKQQWQTVNYMLLIFGAVVALIQVANNTGKVITHLEIYIALITLSVLFTLSIIILCQLQASIKNESAASKEVMKVTPSFKDAFSNKAFSSSFEIVFWTLLLVTTIGFIVTCWFIAK